MISIDTTFNMSSSLVFMSSVCKLLLNKFDTEIRVGVFCIRLQQKKFLRIAAEQKAVKPAMRFVQMLPDSAVDARTYNLLVTVCVKARDLKSALDVKKAVVDNGHRLDRILYTNLISGLHL